MLVCSWLKVKSLCRGGGGGGAGLNLYKVYAINRILVATTSIILSIYILLYSKQC